MKRKFSAEGVMHAYQRTVSGFNLFYTLEDFIVYYTIVAVEAKKFRIRFMGLCMMIDHIHMLLRAGKRTDTDASGFQGDRFHPSSATGILPLHRSVPPASPPPFSSVCI